MKTKKMNLPKHWKREASDRLYRNSGATRWSAKVTTLSAFLAKYGSVLLALDEISSSSSGDAKRDASAYSRLLQDFEFIVALTVSQFVLSLLAQVTKSLQAKSCNLGDAYQSVTLAKECIKSARGDQWILAEGVESNQPGSWLYQSHPGKASYNDCSTSSSKRRTQRSAVRLLQD